MNAVERIEAAIQKLESAKRGDGICVGPWQYLRKGSWSGQSAVADVNGHPLAFVGESEDADRDAELIVTLHSTIDAQLAILRYAVEAWRSVAAEGSPDFLVRHVQGYMAENEIALADAILGDAS